MYWKSKKSCSCDSFLKVIPVTYQLKIWRQIFLNSITGTNVFKCQYAVTLSSPIIHNLTSYTRHPQIFNLEQHIDRVTRKTGLLQPRCDRVHKTLSGRGKIRSGFLYGTILPKTTWDRSNLKISRHIKCITDSKLPFSMLVL